VGLLQLESKQVWVVERCSGYPEQSLQKTFGLLEWCSLMEAVFACGSDHPMMLAPKWGLKQQVQQKQRKKGSQQEQNWQKLQER